MSSPASEFIVPKKLLVVTQTVDREDPNLGFFHRWLEALAKHVDLQVIANKVGSYRLPDNVEIRSLGKERGLSVTRRLWRYQRYLLHSLPRVHAVFFHMCPEYVLGASVWPVVFRKKSLLWYTHKSVTWKLRLAERLVDRIYTASRDSFRLPSNKVEVTGHGIDTELFSPPGEGRQRRGLSILTAGRISPVKKHEVLIEAGELLEQRRTEFEIRIAGAPALRQDAEYRAQLEDLVREKGLSDRVKFLGPIPHEKMVAFYRSGDVFVNLSDTGSLDKAVLEAAACGLAVVTSNEAFEGELPRASITTNDPRELADRLAKVSEREANLRDYVIREHALDELIRRLVANV